MTYADLLRNAATLLESDGSRSDPGIAHLRALADLLDGLCVTDTADSGPLNQNLIAALTAPLSDL